LAFLPIVDASRLDADRRRALKPGELVRDRAGCAYRLPRFFFEIASWNVARETQLASHFGVWEFLDTDVREDAIVRAFPRYVPCAVALLAAHLETFRLQVGAVVHIAANGGYRSPTHALSRYATPHMWGTAANIYKIGDEYLDNQGAIERYAAVASKTLPGVWARPYGCDVGCADDHLHLDIGYVTTVPRGMSEE
jgi:hypothetical protein